VGLGSQTLTNTTYYYYYCSEIQVIPEYTSLQQQYGKSLSSTPHIITHDIINEA
jgi:hypothetical protein